MKEEAAQKLISNKRSQPSHPHTQREICTRTRHRGFSSDSLTKRLRSTKDIDLADADEWSSVLIKDLRIRRVFAGSAESASCVGKEGIKGSDKESDTGVSCDAQNFATAKPSDSSAVKEDMGVCGKERMADDDVNIFNGIASEGNGEILNEECVKGTPPDAEIFGHRFAENGGSKVDFISMKMETASEEPSIGSEPKRESEKEICNGSATKSVHRPWSRLKVFKTPGSVSYRRLLPYLMDMVKDDSSVSNKTNCTKKEGPGISIDYGSSCGTDLHLTSPELVGSEKDCRQSFNNPNSVDEGCCSKPLVSEGTGKIEIGASSTVHISHLNDPVDGEQIKRSDDVKDVRQCFSSIMEKQQLNETDEVGQCSDKTTASDSLGLEATDTMYPSKAVGLDHISPNLCATERTSRTCHAEKEVVNKVGVLEKNDHSSEDSIQLTSPDTDIFDTPEAYNNVDNRFNCVSKRADRVIGRPLDEDTLRSNSCSGDNKMDSIPKRKSVLNPFSQLKLFKTQSSFSYRRLLPYLMDITKERSGASGNVDWPKLEKCSEEEPLSLHIPPSTSDGNETPIEKSDGDCYHVEHDANPSNTLQMATLTASSHPYNNLQTCLTYAEPDSETPVSLGSPKKEITAGDMLDKDKQIDNALDIVPSIDGNSSPTMPLSFVSAHSLNSVSPGLPVVNEGVCMASVFKLTNCAKPVEAGSLSQNSYQPQAFYPLGTPPPGYKRSILKRNPRGCRGRCECLNCVSFHLHAERAFEFSENQMRDAEEVAFDLIKELSQLRTILEKSAFGSDDHLVVFNDQVKEACRKASEAEEIAKSRLKEMNYDLNIHSRITCGERPRVRFANIVDERAIP